MVREIAFINQYRKNMKTTDKRRTASAHIYSQKVYSVVFGEIYKNDDILNVDSYTVLADHAKMAIEEAYLKLDKRYHQKYFVQAVIFLNEID